MAENKFKLGDIVKLSSTDYPEMVIGKKGTHRDWNCTYFTNLEQGFVHLDFYEHELRLIKAFGS